MLDPLQNAQREIQTLRKAKGLDLSHAARDVFDERRRQVEKEGWTPEHDDQHEDGAIAAAAACYAIGKDSLINIGGHIVRLWPWEDWCWKPKDRRRDLVRAGALIIAEIERLDRAEKQST